jgi:N-methylhydantoinase A
MESMELHTIGAGGGSLIWQDSGGALRVGPRSAGADPGPACYGRGEQPCVTDAHVVLGRLPATTKLGGFLPLQPERSEAALAKVARLFSIRTIELAQAVLEVSDSAMERAIKVITLERGHDPRDLALFSFGGAGGLHACRLALRLGMLEDRVRKLLQRELGSGSLRSEVQIACRYHGQSYEIRVPLKSGFERHFEDLHEGQFGFRLADQPLECVAVHATAWRPSKYRIQRQPARSRSVASAVIGKVRLLEGGHRARQNATLLDRQLLRPGMKTQGPAIVLEDTATTVVENNFSLRVDATLCLRMKAMGSVS